MDEEEHIETYGDPFIATGHGAVPGWLILSYILLPPIGLLWYYLYWDGSWGWLDPGHWAALQEAAKTRWLP